MLSDEQRKKIEQAIDGKATSRPLDDGTIKASRWITAWAAQDIAKRLYPLIEQWISEAVTDVDAERVQVAEARQAAEEYADVVTDRMTWLKLERDNARKRVEFFTSDTWRFGVLEAGDMPDGWKREVEQKPGIYSVGVVPPRRIVITGPWQEVEG